MAHVQVTVAYTLKRAGESSRYNMNTCMYFDMETKNQSLARSMAQDKLESKYPNAEIRITNIVMK